MSPTDHLARVRTFHPRRGRLSARHHEALDRLWPRYGLEIPTNGGTIDPYLIFGRHAPLVLEIGSGMGDATAAMAGADRDRDYLAVDVHTPGIAHLLHLIHDAGLTNVRLTHGDALDLLNAIAPDSLDAIHAFFPDPWPKARHHKRRLFQPPHVHLMTSRLTPGGTLHLATDNENYAQAALAVTTANPELENPTQGFTPRGNRPPTRFEQRALTAGRKIYDLIVTRGFGGRVPSEGIKPDRPERAPCRQTPIADPAVRS